MNKIAIFLLSVYSLSSFAGVGGGSGGTRPGIQFSAKISIPMRVIFESRSNDGQIVFKKITNFRVEEFSLFPEEIAPNYRRALQSSLDSGQAVAVEAN